MSNHRTKSAAQARVWKLMFNTFMASVPARSAALQERGLTPNDARALFSLGKGAPRPIGELARDWGCDPSNATFIVRRLETAGLIERTVDPSDQRRRLLNLSARGDRMKRELLEAYLRPPSALSRLTGAELDALEALLRKLNRQED